MVKKIGSYGYRPTFLVYVDSNEYLCVIRIPTLIICGREDSVTPLVQSIFMHEHIEDSNLKFIDNAGHVSNLEQPEEFNKYLRNSLNSLDSVSSELRNL